MGKFELKSDYKPTGDQPKAIRKLLNGLGKDICREVMENADEWYRENPKERKGWVVA